MYKVTFSSSEFAAQCTIEGHWTEGQDLSVGIFRNSLWETVNFVSGDKEIYNRLIELEQSMYADEVQEDEETFLYITELFDDFVYSMMYEQEPDIEYERDDYPVWDNELQMWI